MTPYVVTTPVINLIKNTKYYRSILVDWIISNQDLLGIHLPHIDPNADFCSQTKIREEIESVAKKIKFIEFSYSHHGRVKNNLNNKSKIYEGIADLIYNLDKGAGLVYKKNVLYRYLSDPKHSNLNIDFIKLGAQVRAVYRHKYKCEEIKEKDL